MDQYINKFKHLKEAYLLEYKWNESIRLEKAIHLEMDNKGDNYWGLLNGFTYYTNHMANPVDKSIFLTYGYGKIINDKAIKYIKQKINYTEPV